MAFIIDFDKSFKWISKAAWKMSLFPNIFFP